MYNTTERHHTTLHACTQITYPFRVLKKKTPSIVCAYISHPVSRVGFRRHLRLFRPPYTLVALGGCLRSQLVFWRPSAPRPKQLRRRCPRIRPRPRPSQDSGITSSNTATLLLLGCRLPVALAAAVAGFRREAWRG